MSKKIKVNNIWSVEIKLPTALANAIVAYGINNSIRPKVLDKRILDAGIIKLQESQGNHDFLTKCFNKNPNNLIKRKMRVEKEYNGKLNLFTSLLQSGKGKLNRVIVECFVLGAIELQIIDDTFLNS